MENYLSTRVAYGEALATLGDQYDFVVLDADLSKATQTCLFAKKFPGRFFNIGISEGDMMSTAAGLASCGKMVFASTFAMFAAGRAYEQIRNSIAYNGLNVKICATHAGVLIGEDGASHQCIEDISLMRTIPGMTVIVPCDQYSAYRAVEAAIHFHGPVYLRFGRMSSRPVYQENPDFQIGKGIVLREGNDVTIVAIGDLVKESMKAAEILAAKGVSAAVIDMHTVKPIDRDLIIKYASVSKKVITAEDHSIIGGLGSAVAEVLAEGNLAQLRRVGIMDCFGRSGTRDALMEKYELNAEKIVKTYDSFQD
ncbi:transketolase family protein [Caproiciproducens faecalis]|uniref:Transketolase family protein n=1 Tax=Caproiciproducens faecalis TaxID=2820301 RepID=A0ABS7DNL3_9FIRM|nr:transketolase family protein [Caproiciproducens faecalis]MBW7572672.1 transketolase family protein [Caproiciproducens faecalis]